MYSASNAVIEWLLVVKMLETEIHLFRYSVFQVLLLPAEKILKRPKIKQGTTLKVNCILFNRLLSPVLLNKSGLNLLISIRKFKQVFL